MKPISLNYKYVLPFVSQKEIDNLLEEKREQIADIFAAEKKQSDVLGWVDIDSMSDALLLENIKKKAEEIRENADVFLLIGVGGSNQGARAVIEVLGDNKLQILYAGNNLSPAYIHNILKQIKGKSVYVNVIAKNFATLEPGIVFRVIRKYMEEEFGTVEAGKRIIATGSPGGSSLEKLSELKRYTFLPFPHDVGGRFSVLSAVGLLPIAVAGIDIYYLLAGARDMKKLVQTTKPAENPAVTYAAVRNLLLEKGYSIEILAFFEPLLHYFSKWWIQLFGESEGKEGKGIYPTACSFSEDLHSLGQYIQQGQRILFETFLHLDDQGASCQIPLEEGDIDHFGYLDNKNFTFLNESAFYATVKAHFDGGVPGMILNIPELTPYYLGQLFYFFEYACFISGTLLGVNPFDQPGVEDYKKNMFKILGE